MKKLLLAIALTCTSLPALARVSDAILGNIALEETPQMNALKLQAQTIWRAMFVRSTFEYGYVLGDPIAPSATDLARSIELQPRTRVHTTDERCGGPWMNDAQCIVLYGRFYRFLPVLKSSIDH